MISCVLKKCDCFNCILSSTLTYSDSQAGVCKATIELLLFYFTRKGFPNPLWHSSLNLGELKQLQ